MPARQNPSMQRALALVAPGQVLREGLDRILQSKMGALVVVGDGPAVLEICSGGFLLEAEYSPQRLSELAKMDGAIILDGDASRIARANVHLLPDPKVPTSETGTRHRTAERVARSLDVPVISVSEEMGLISVYRGEQKHTLQPMGRLFDRVTQALQTLEHYRSHLDLVNDELSSHEVHDSVTVRDVALVLQRCEMVRRIADEIDASLVELGDEGRLIELQRDELRAGVDREAMFLLRDYLPGSWDDGGRKAFSGLATSDLVDLHAVAHTLGLDAASPSTATSGNPLAAPLHPRGYRVLSRLPRLTDSAIAHLVAHFGSLAPILDASIAELIEVEGIGDVRARAIRDGLARIVDASRRDPRMR
jgi:diadenylate cyclase